MERYIICSIGLTAAGKTTTMRSISENCGLYFVSEASIKRKMVTGEYTVVNSTDEKLRSLGYRKAISEAFDHIQKSNESAIIDASFHQQFRRDWIYEEIQKRKLTHITVIWIYCICEDEKTVENRIFQRYISPIKNADNQANTMEVYYYTKSTFDKVSINNFSSIIPTLIITFDTHTNRIKCTASNANLDIKKINIDRWRELWENYM